LRCAPSTGLASEPAYADLPVVPSGPIPGVVLDAIECELVDQRGELIVVGSVVTSWGQQYCLRIERARWAGAA
jgi:hypothetical protein